MASVLCAVICFVFHLSYGYLSPLVAIFVLVLFRDQTVGAGVPAFFGCLVAGGVALAICAVLAGAPFALALCMLSWLFVWMAFLPRFPLGRALGGILIAMVLFSVALGTARPEDLVTGFWTQVFIGIAVAAAFDRLVWPSGAADTLHETLATVFEDFAGTLEALGADMRGGYGGAAVPEGDLSHLSAISNVLKHAFGGRSDAEFKLKFRCWLIWDRLQALARHARSGQLVSLDGALASRLEDIVSGLAIHFRELADSALHRRRGGHLAPETMKKVDDLVELLRDARFREPRVTDRTLSAATLIKLLTHCVSDHDRLADAYNALLQSEIALKPRRSDAIGPAAGGFFSWPTADTLKTSAKIVLITLILLIGVTYLGFPGSSVVAFYGITFGLMVNLGQLYLKGRTGILGAALGLAYGALGVLIVVQSPHLPVLLGVYALGVFIAVYVATGDEPVSFLGLQGALIIPYVFLIFEGPEWTLANAVTRAAALAISAAVAVVVQRLIWPVDPLVMFRGVVAKALADIALSWERLWRAGGVGGIGPTASGRDVSEDLVVSFSRCAEWLKDSQYLTGSAHVAARRYARILGSLEEVLAELNLLVRVLEGNAGNRLIEDARDQLKEPIDTVGRGFEALASYYRDPADAVGLMESRRRLAEVRDLANGHRDLIETPTDASLEDRRDVSVLLHTVSDVAASLALALDETLETPPAADRRGGDRARSDQPTPQARSMTT